MTVGRLEGTVETVIERRIFCAVGRLSGGVVRFRVDFRLSMSAVEIPKTELRLDKAAGIALSVAEAALIALKPCWVEKEKESVRTWQSPVRSEKMQRKTYSYEFVDLSVRQKIGH